MTILDRLAEHAKERAEEAKRTTPLFDIRRQAEGLPKGTFSFEKALKKQDISFICECKKASPSKGLIAPRFPYLDIAKDYEAAGADAVSVLTEPKWFLGSDEYLQGIANNSASGDSAMDDVGYPGTGGIVTWEFDETTMGSRLVPGLYACGEVLDVDGACGGYNLQWAWSSGRLAGAHAGGNP